MEHETSMRVARIERAGICNDKCFMVILAANLLSKTRKMKSLHEKLVNRIGVTIFDFPQKHIKPWFQN
jgi:hypothetical protein